jgi:predicted lipid-binding transport protein (Tim44 family)
MFYQPTLQRRKFHMKKLFLSFAIILFSFTVIMDDASARRMGGGRSIGTQRQATPPSQRQATPAQAPTPANAAPKRGWLGPVAGLAAGLGLAALASRLGLGEEMGSFLLILLVVVGGLFLFRLISRKAPQLQPQGAGGNGQFPRFESLQPASGAANTGNYAHNIPADFDRDAFLRVAKVNFVRLQAANDAGNFDDLREFTSPEVFAELKLDIDERQGKSQQTEVVTLEAELLDVGTLSGKHFASVQFSGLIREEEAAEHFTEIWHLAKPIDGASGWVVAGIQQTQ